MNLSLTFRLFIIIFFSASIALADENDNDKKEDQLLDNQRIIALDEETQKLSGIQTEQMKPVNHKAEFTAYGKAISLQPLLILRNRYLVALTEHNLATATFKQVQQNLSRQQELYSSGVSSKRLLQDYQMQWQNAKSQLDAANFQTQSIREETLLNWGKTLTEWGLSTNSDKLDAFLSSQQRLLQITLPAGKQISDNTPNIYIEISGDRSKAHAATLISKSPQPDSNEQGPSYFFQTGDSNIRSGVRLTVWIPEQDKNKSGVIIPKSALVWSLDQSLVYIKVDKEKFNHRLITDYTITADGYFIPQDIKPGEEIVTSGAQMLMSEELRQQLTHEQDSD